MPAVTGRLPKELLKIPASFYERHGIELAFLFGSAADEPPAAARDLDVAVLFSDYYFQRYLKTFAELSALVKRRDVDLVVLNLCNPALKMEVLTNGILLYRKDEVSFTEFAVDTFFAYEDYLYFKNEYNTCWRERVREGLLVAGRQLNRERIETCLSQMDQAVQRLKDLRRRFLSYEEFTLDLDTWVFAGIFWQLRVWRCMSMILPA